MIIIRARPQMPESGRCASLAARPQKLHIRTVPLHEQPRRIAHQESTRSIAVTTTKATFAGGAAGGGVGG